MDQLQKMPLTICLGKVTLAAGTTTTLSNTGTTVFAIRSKAYSKAAMANAATPTTDWATGAAFIPVLVNQGSVYMVGFDSGGALRVIQGSVTALDGALAATAKFITAPTFGALGPSGSGTNSGDFCPVGYIIIKCGSDFVAGSWIFGTNNLSAVTGVNYTFVDVIGEPDRPQVS